MCASRQPDVCQCSPLPCLCNLLASLKVIHDKPEQGSELFSVSEHRLVLSNWQPMGQYLLHYRSLTGLTLATNCTKSCIYFGLCSEFSFNLMCSTLTAIWLQNNDTRVPNKPLFFPDFRVQLWRQSLQRLFNARHYI